jgi:uncharacterized protein YjdB
VTGITVSPKTLTLEVGKTYRPTVTLSPANATDKSVTWTTSNKNVVALVKDSSGRLYLKGVASGSAKITFKALRGTNVSTSMTVTVKSKSSYSLGEDEDEGYTLLTKKENEDFSTGENSYSLSEGEDAVYSVTESSAGTDGSGGGCDVGLGFFAVGIAALAYLHRKGRDTK